MTVSLSRAIALSSNGAVGSRPALLAAVSMVVAQLILTSPLPRRGPIRGTGRPGSGWLMDFATRARGLYSARSGRATAASAVEVTEFAAAWAAELRAGRSPGQALVAAVSEVGDPVVRAALRPASDSVGLGGDPATFLRHGASQPGCELLRPLAAAWEVGAGRGAGLADSVERMAEVGRSRLQHQREVAAHLAAPRATARLLAGLPLFGWLLGMALGARPLSFLLSTPPGWCVTLVGVSLELLGLRWTSALARRAEHPP